MIHGTYRHLLLSDIDVMADIINKSRCELPLHHPVTVEKMKAETFDDPDYDPEGFWLCEIGNHYVGYGGGVIEKSRVEFGLNDGWVTIEVLPEWRGKGIEQELMKKILDYLSSNTIAVAQRWCMGTEGWRHSLARESGFEPIHYEYLFIWESDVPPPVYPPPEGISFEYHMFKETSDEDIAQFVDVFNNSFSEHYNFSPAPVGKFIRSRNTDNDASRLVFAKKGKKIVGICLYGEWTTYNKQHDTKIGEIGILGVLRPYRRNGLGRALLSESMNWIANRGNNTIYLEVDAENRNALHLYTSMGFKMTEENTIYRKNLG
ncbi:MAG: GNAT family N-acetyltransferase [Theionarchaea archaeon]|nr:GNAT family N-acetyltransferase [Theionarchaea archaeon]